MRSIVDDAVAVLGRSRSSASVDPLRRSADASRLTSRTRNGSAISLRTRAWSGSSRCTIVCVAWACSARPVELELDDRVRRGLVDVARHRRVAQDRGHVVEAGDHPAVQQLRPVHRVVVAQRGVLRRRATR